MSEFLSPAVLELSTPALYGVLAAAVLVAGAVVLLLLDGAYLIALLTFLAGRAARKRETVTGQAEVLVISLLCAATPLGAQRDDGSVRTIEPRYTRIFGADTMEIFGPTMSPDGRWIAFVREEGAEAYNLWLVATAGGDPIRITSGRHSDDRPEWFPTGDRLLFRSNRTQSLMTIPIDPNTGRASGPPRQVSLDFPNFSSTVSPDGREIAYVVARGEDQRIVVIPATGGTARTVVEYDGTMRLGTLRWTPDDWLYFTGRAPGEPRRSLYRVRASGGVPEALPSAAAAPPSAPAMTHLSADGRFILTRVDQGPGQESLFRVATTHDGRVLAQFSPPRNSMPAGFTPEGRGVLLTQSNRVAPIRVVPVAGGPVRQLTDAREYDWPLGWSADGSRAFLQTQVNGHQAILAVPVGGGPATRYSIPVEARSPIRLSRDGRFLLYAVGEDPLSRTLRIRRLADGETREIREPAHYPVQPGAMGVGGSWFTTDEGFLTFARAGDRLELWVTPLEGKSRLIRAFPFSYAGRTGFGVHGDRVAYRERRGDSTALFVTEGRNSRPRHLATVIGDANQPSWSRNGRWIAYDYYPLGDYPRYGVLLVGVAPDGGVTSPPRILEAGPMWGWQVQWLPGDEAFTVFGMTGAASETHVYLVSLREGERPVVLTRDDPSVRWGYELSPDGRYVAYPAEIPRGSSIWRVDLSEVLAAAR